MRTKEEILKPFKDSFTGNGDYYFEYVKPEDCLKAMGGYAKQKFLCDCVSGQAIETAMGIICYDCERPM